MQLNISAVKTYLRSPLEWYYAHHLRRIPRQFIAPLEVGQVWHHIMEAFYFTYHGDEDAALRSGMAFYKKRRDEAVAEGCDQKFPKDFEKFVKESDLLFLYFKEWRNPLPNATIEAVETPIEVTLPGTEHTLIGKPDVLAHDSLWWHVQHRTLSDRTNMGTYLDAAQRDLHELGYAWLVSRSRSLHPSEYGGTWFNILRKISATAFGREPHKAFVQQPVPLEHVQIEEAVSDLIRIALDMDEIARGLRRPVSNRDADKDRFGHYLSPYFQVYLGKQDIYDDRFFMDAPDRYAEAPVEADS